ncbi:MAG: hypothetical protein IT285_02320 [Bdellovibrionales bacterium]|nr:hypothetical protein [Bdellovibrionales bacterium]
MKRMISLLTLALLPTSALAHLELGTYQGVAADGSVCSFEVLRDWHENDLHHGLNHRGEIRAAGYTMIVSHPPVVDLEAGTVRMDHDHLVGVTGITKAGVAFVIEMDHSPGNDGPKSFTVLKDDYMNSALSTRSSCGSLTHVEE